MRSHARTWPRLVSLSLAALVVAPRASAQLEDPDAEVRAGARRVAIAPARSEPRAPDVATLDLAHDLLAADAACAARAVATLRQLPAECAVPLLRDGLARWLDRKDDSLARHAVRLVLDALYQLGATLTPAELARVEPDNAQLDLVLLFAAREPRLHVATLRNVWPRAGGLLQHVCSNLRERAEPREFASTLLDELRFELRVAVEDPPTADTGRTSFGGRKLGGCRRAPPSIIEQQAVPVYDFTCVASDAVGVVAPGPSAYAVTRSDVRMLSLPSLAERGRALDTRYAVQTLNALAGNVVLADLGGARAPLRVEWRDATAYYDAVQPACDALASDWSHLLARLAARNMISAERARLPLPLTLVIDDRRAVQDPPLPRVGP